MSEIIAYCGLKCSNCLAYIATQKNDKNELDKVAKEWSQGEMEFTPDDIRCDGCNTGGRIFSWCEECPIRICCKSRSLESCAFCEDYGCDKLQKTFENDPTAKITLDQIKKQL